MKKSLNEARIDLVAIGRRIRELRGFDMTQAEFARRIDVAQGYLSALERGEKEPGAAVLLAISRTFGKSVDWLLTGKKECCGSLSSDRGLHAQATATKRRGK
jgi:transcriptional regulator with XRE-family HTH domain